MAKFTFDRAAQTLVATRDFSHGTIFANKGDTLTSEQVAGLDDTTVSRLVNNSKVVKVVSLEDAAKATDKASAEGKAPKA